MQHFSPQVAHSDPLSDPFFILLLKISISKSQSVRWQNKFSYFAYKYVNTNRGTLNSVIKSDPLATEPK